MQQGRGCGSFSFCLLSTAIWIVMYYWHAACLIRIRVAEFIVDTFGTEDGKIILFIYFT
jgi:hypothetical protein